MLSLIKNKKEVFIKEYLELIGFFIVISDKMSLEKQGSEFLC